MEKPVTKFSKTSSASARKSMFFLSLAVLSAFTHGCKTSDAQLKNSEEVNSKPIFAEGALINLKLSYRMSDLERDKSKEIPAQFTIEQGKPISVTISVRGNTSLEQCLLPKLKLHFPKTGRKGTFFENNGGLKIRTHCDYQGNPFFTEQTVLRESVVHALARELDPISFQTRLVKIEYSDTDTPEKKIGPKYALLIEDNDDLAKRTKTQTTDEFDEYRIKTLDSNTLASLRSKFNAKYLLKMHLLQIIIGNGDWNVFGISSSINMSYQPFKNAVALKSVGEASGSYFAVPYDFNISSFCQGYAVKSDERLSRLKYAKELFPQIFDEVKSIYRGKKVNLLGVIDSARLESEDKSNLKTHVEDFFAAFESI